MGMLAKTCTVCEWALIDCVCRECPDGCCFAGITAYLIDSGCDIEYWFCQYCYPGAFDYQTKNVPAPLTDGKAR